MNILNNGYIELVPKSLSPESELMATFATKNSSGIILAGLSRGLEKRRRRQAHLASTENKDLLVLVLPFLFSNIRSGFYDCNMQRTRKKLRRAQIQRLGGDGEYSL